MTTRDEPSPEERLEEFGLNVANMVAAFVGEMRKLKAELAAERQAHEHTKRELTYERALHRQTGLSLAAALERAIERKDRP